jgi:hypothetical protein
MWLVGRTGQLPKAPARGGIGGAGGGAENAPKRPPPASSRFPWTKRCRAYPPHALRCASQCRRSRSTLALESGRRWCSVLDERYREDMPRARRRGSVGSPVGWGRGPVFASVADGTEAAAGGWAGGPAIISICMSDHTHRVPPQYFRTDWILPHDRNYCHKHHPSLSLTCSTRPWQLYPSDSRWEPD